MNITALKIVLDTNILLAIISRKSPFRWIFDCITNGKIILCISNEILFEYQEILTKKLSPNIAENIVNFLTINPFTIKTDIYFNFGLIYQDSDDNKFVDCAIASNAICIVSNDKHFQILKEIDFPQILVLKLQEFEDKYKENLTRI
ncbi:MAG: putative toxin-antitoxin system toxin component, PIN family [Acidobacteriota bacterium]|jgi:putative PIN family toxin of toxin-antitoxin system|nr:putative toxin-antitoxin system toxin component, PIN family [Acidobacteriota bacterium]